MAIDFSGFEFGVTIHQGMNWDNLRLPQRFASIVDGKEPHHVLLRMYSGAAGLCSAEVMFDGEGQMLLHNEWRRVARSHTIEVSHFFVLKYNGHNIFTVKVFDETICRRHLGVKIKLEAQIDSARTRTLMSRAELTFLAC
jgi:hypothetical protein